MFDVPPTPQLKDMQALENRVARSGTVLQVHVPDHILHSSLQCGSVAKQPFLVDFVFQVSPEKEIADRQIRRSSWPMMVQMLSNGPAPKETWSLEVLPHTVHNMWPSPVLLKPHLQGKMIFLAPGINFFGQK